MPEGSEARGNSQRSVDSAAAHHYIPLYSNSECKYNDSNHIPFGVHAHCYHAISDVSGPVFCRPKPHRADHQTHAVLDIFISIRLRHLLINIQSLGCGAVFLKYTQISETTRLFTATKHRQCKHRELHRMY